jgi:hypothetical protein
MKLVLGTFLGLGLIATGASAAKVEFLGGVCLTQVSAACQAEGYSVGQCLWMRYNPPNIADNPPATRFTFIDFRGAENYALDSGSLIGKAYKTVTATFVYRGGGQQPAQMRITKQDPADLSDADFASLTGNIKDFDGISGCTIQFKASGVRHEN